MMTDMASGHTWPDSFDALVMLIFAACAILIPAAGYFFMVVDYRAYLRSLRRNLVRFISRGRGDLPEWALRETPRCLSAFGLTLQSTEEELTRQYRAQIKQLHPDRGGDRRRFMTLQSHFEDSLRLIRRHRAD